MLTILKYTRPLELKVQQSIAVPLSSTGSFGSTIGDVFGWGKTLGGAATTALSRTYIPVYALTHPVSAGAGSDVIPGSSKYKARIAPILERVAAEQAATPYYVLNYRQTPDYSMQATLDRYFPTTPEELVLNMFGWTKKGREWLAGKIAPKNSAESTSSRSGSVPASRTTNPPVTEEPTETDLTSDYGQNVSAGGTGGGGKKPSLLLRAWKWSKKHPVKATVGAVGTVGTLLAFYPTREYVMNRYVWPGVKYAFLGPDSVDNKITKPELQSAQQSNTSNDTVVPVMSGNPVSQGYIDSLRTARAKEWASGTYTP